MSVEQIKTRLLRRSIHPNYFYLPVASKKSFTRLYIHQVIKNEYDFIADKFTDRTVTKGWCAGEILNEEGSRVTAFDYYDASIDVLAEQKYIIKLSHTFLFNPYDEDFKTEYEIDLTEFSEKEYHFYLTATPVAFKSKMKILRIPGKSYDHQILEYSTPQVMYDGYYEWGDYQGASVTECETYIHDNLISRNSTPLNGIDRSTYAFSPANGIYKSRHSYSDGTSDENIAYYAYFTDKFHVLSGISGEWLALDDISVHTGTITSIPIDGVANSYVDQDGTEFISNTIGTDRFGAFWEVQSEYYSARYSYPNNTDIAAPVTNGWLARGNRWSCKYSTGRTAGILSDIAYANGAGSYQTTDIREYALHQVEIQYPNYSILEEYYYENDFYIDPVIDEIMLRFEDHKQYLQSNLINVTGYYNSMVCRIGLSDALYLGSCQFDIINIPDEETPAYNLQSNTHINSGFRFRYVENDEPSAIWTLEFGGFQKKFT